MLCLSGFELYSRWVPLKKTEDIEGYQEDIKTSMTNFRSTDLPAGK